MSGNQHPPKKISYFFLETVKMSLLPPGLILECDEVSGDVRLLVRRTLAEQVKVRFTDQELPLIRALFEMIYAPYAEITPLTDDGHVQTVRDLLHQCEARLLALGLQVAAVAGHGFLLVKPGKETQP